MEKINNMVNVDEKTFNTLTALSEKTGLSKREIMRQIFDGLAIVKEDSLPSTQRLTFLAYPSLKNSACVIVVARLGNLFNLAELPEEIQEQLKEENKKALVEESKAQPVIKNLQTDYPHFTKKTKKEGN